MGWGSSSYAICATHCLIVCFIFFGFFTRGAVEGQPYYCDRSWCGNVHIRYPFRLKGDPANCGDRNYELTCNRSDNRTFMEFTSILYLVNQINYYRQVIHVTDVAVLNSTCSLPLKFLPSNSIDTDYRLQTYFRPVPDNEWVSIMKCSKKLIANSESYKLFPCQSTFNDSYVYSVSGNRVTSLAPSCSFLSWTPTIYDDLNNTEDIFQVIKDGFYLSWRNPNYFFCDRSSCGDIQIRNPFSLKDYDPEDCGNPHYQLTCSSDDETFMVFASNQYLVKQINYTSKVIQVIDVGLLSSDCSLPLNFLPTDLIGMTDYQFGAYNISVSIMNCSKKIAPEGYQLFPCRTRDNSYMYGVVRKDGAPIFDPSCSFISWMPAMYSSFISNYSHTFLRPKDIFQVIRDGFFLSWEQPSELHLSLSMAIVYCLDIEYYCLAHCV